MVRRIARVAGRDVVHTMSLVFDSESDVQTYPFDDDPEYRLDFKVGHSEKDNIHTRTTGDYLTVYIPSPDDDSEDGGWIATKRGLNFASDDNYEYWLHLVMRRLGNASKGPFLLTINVSRVKK